MDPRKQRTMDALTRAAQELFRDRTLDEVTVEELAARAGVAVGSIYNHFGSKAGLYAAVVEQALEVDREYMERAYTQERSPLEQLLAAAAEYLNLAIDHPDYFRMMAHPYEPGQYPAGREQAERMGAQLAEQNARVAETLQKAMDEGIFRQLDPKKLALGIWAAWAGIITLRWRHDELRANDEELQELLLLAIDVVLNGLMPRN